MADMKNVVVETIGHGLAGLAVLAGAFVLIAASATGEVGQRSILVYTNGLILVMLGALMFSQFRGGA